MTLTVAFTEQAEQELLDIIDFVRQRSPNGALKIGLSIQAAVTQLSSFPESGSETNVGVVRSLIAPGYPYRIFYRLCPTQVEIIHVRHTSREPSGFGET